MVIINILAIIIENLDFLEVKNQKKEMHTYCLLPGVILNNVKNGNNGPTRVQKSIWGCTFYVEAMTPSPKA